MTLVHITLLTVTALFVGFSGWKVCTKPHGIAGAVTALLLYSLNPLILSGSLTLSAWDAFFASFFVAAWVGMVDWSLFMRSWVLASFYALGLWVGSGFIFWIPIAMLAWALLNRRPAEARVSFLTVFFGGTFFFIVVWGLTWLVDPQLGRPAFLQWIRWTGFDLTIYPSVPWSLLVLAATLETIVQTVKTRRSDVLFFIALLIVLAYLFGSPSQSLALVALASILVAYMIVRREFLYQRAVRSTAALTFILMLGLYLTGGRAPTLFLSLAVIGLGMVARWFRKPTPLPWRLAAEAACIGAYFAESIGNLLVQ